MPNAISKAGKRLFAPDPDVRRYAAADTAYEQDEYVAEAEDERADRRKVRSFRVIFSSISSHSNNTHASHPFPAMLSWAELTSPLTTYHIA
jgi:hypothetical protein